MNKPKERHISQNSTIYTFTLVKRVHHTAVFLAIWWVLAFAMLFWELSHTRWIGFFAALLIVPVAHALLIALILRKQAGLQRHEWRWSFQPPWFGLIPVSYAALPKVRTLELQLFFIMLVLIGCLYPWLALESLIVAVFVHLWVTLPRLGLLWRFRSYQEKGYMIINEKDTSCYFQ